MASTVQAVLQNPGDILGPLILNPGVGNPVDQSAIASFTGVYANATIAIEGIPLGQPLTQVAVNQNPVPASAAEWVPILEVGVLDGIPISSPVGPLTSAGTAGTGFAFTFGTTVFSQLRARLVSIGSGQVQGGLASVPFQIPASLSGQNSSLLLELQRIRVGISSLVETDLKEVVPALTSTGA